MDFLLKREDYIKSTGRDLVVNLRGEVILDVLYKVATLISEGGKGGY